MLRRFRQWLSGNRDWRRVHDLAWAPVISVGPDGLSAFMHSTRDQLLSAVSGLDFELAGESEKFLRGTIPGTSAVLFLYGDGAQIHDGPKELYWAEYYDYQTPKSLTDELVSEVLELRSKNSFKPIPLPGSA